MFYTKTIKEHVFELSRRPKKVSMCFAERVPSMLTQNSAINQNGGETKRNSWGRQREQLRSLKKRPLSRNKKHRATFSVFSSPKRRLRAGRKEQFWTAPNIEDQNSLHIRALNIERLEKNNHTSYKNKRQRAILRPFAT